MSEIGKMVGNYRILEQVGIGGMGKVFLGLDTMLNREVAIKVLRQEMTQHPSLVERFRNEARVLAKLNHPNIALLYNLIFEENLFFMVMEFVRGETLEFRLKRLGQLPYDQAIKVFTQILDAIGYAHQNGIIHRDLKPSNVMITPEGAVKVMDFGIARVLGSERMTSAGLVVGTIEYISPEQINGLDCSERTDIYSLGILLYEMLSGHLPFKSSNQFELMRAHIDTPPPPPRTYAPHIPIPLEEAILKALAKKPEDRFKSAFEFRAAVMQIIRHSSRPFDATELLEIEERDFLTHEEYARHTVANLPGPETAGAEVRQRLLEEARRQSEQEASRIAHEERKRLIEQARKQAEEDAARFAKEERSRLLEEARKQAEEEAARLGEAERKRLIELARHQAEQEAANRAEAERQRLVEEARKRAEKEASHRAESERLRLIDAARRQAEQQAANLAASERQRLFEAARQQAEQEAARIGKEEGRRLLEQALKETEQEVTRLAAVERKKLLEEALKQAEHQANELISAERKRLFEDARKSAEAVAAERAAAERQRLLSVARKQAEEEAARLATEEEERLFEEARTKAEEEAAFMGAQERTRLLEEARKRAEQQASERASKERQRLVAAARHQAEEDAERLGEEERRRLLDKAHKQAEEEAARLGEEERQRLLEDARKRAEKDAARHSAKERKRLIADEKKRAKQDAQRQSAELAFRPDPFGTTRLSGDFPQPGLGEGANLSTVERKFPLSWIVAGVALLLILATVVFIYATRKKTSSGTDAKPDMVRIPGGTFRMGRDYEKLANEDAIWAALQTPSHEVKVGPFEMDRTEVNNSVYARFVSETGHQPPSDWGAKTPPRGMEQWPVRNVSFADAQAFATWRSRRDGVTYQLPTEAEWEFAARGQNNYRYPWGNEWSNDRANVETGSPKPIKSYPRGASAYGVFDLIGNVGEWTLSQATVYPGNAQIPEQELQRVHRGKYAVRGGSFESSPNGEKPITVTSRGFFVASDKAASIGFRLIRPSP